MKKFIMLLVISVSIITGCSNYYMPTPSMDETLQLGDHIISLWFFGEIQRGDILVFTSPVESQKNKDYVKRCIALPGDKFSIKDGFVYLNDRKLDEPYTCGKPTDYESASVSESNSIEGIVPQGKIIVLGDNRVNSFDSRHFGYLDISAVKSRVKYIYWNTKNLSRIGTVK